MTHSVSPSRKGSHDDSFPPKLTRSPSKRSSHKAISHEETTYKITKVVESYFRKEISKQERNLQCKQLRWEFLNQYKVSQ